MEYTHRSSLDLPLPRDEVFAFFADATNLERITPPELRFRILSEQPIVLGPGSLIDYRLCLHGVPLTWRTHIAFWDPPNGFVDEQLRGPYAQWIHTHTFTDLPTGGTRINDEVRYRLPFGPLGRLVHPLIRRQVGRIFEYREGMVRAALGGGSTANHENTKGTKN